MAVLAKRTREDPRRGETERAFLRATEELLDEGASFADLNVSRIAARADRTRTAFYAHFADRRALLFGLVDELAADMDARTAPFFAGPGDRAAIATTVGAILGVFRAHRSLVRAVVEAAGYDEEIARFWNDGVVGRFLAATAERLRRDGRPDAQARATAHALVWMTERACYQHVMADAAGRGDADIVDALADVWAHALVG